MEHIVTVAPSQYRQEFSVGECDAPDCSFYIHGWTRFVYADAAAHVASYHGHTQEWAEHVRMATQ